METGTPGVPLVLPDKVTLGATAGFIAMDTLLLLYVVVPQARFCVTASHTLSPGFNEVVFSSSVPESAFAPFTFQRYTVPGALFSIMALNVAGLPWQISCAEAKTYI